MSAEPVTPVFDYAAEPKELVACNLCAHDTARHAVAVQDRYGLPQRAVRCETCSLVFLSPRMTADAYRRFYETGAYRRLVSAFHGREINAQTIQPEQREYGRRLAGLLEPWAQPEVQHLLDVGGSTGVVAAELAKALHLSGVVIVDPAAPELAEATAEAPSYALTTLRSTVEALDLGPTRFGLITLCQTVDHLLDPMAALRKIRGLLAPGGLFWVDALDYDKTRTIKIDHPYNFTERTMLAYLSRAGFKVLLTDRHNDHVGFVCRGAA